MIVFDIAIVFLVASVAVKALHDVFAKPPSHLRRRSGD